ncbi:CD-NTase-associated protein 7 [Vibrio crassostreae]|uniref:Bacterial HORMA domain-containing protein n=1 Tax=Vibrio tasmaniensis TaxID=212663 RepID=A0A0H3ZW23_9VIBR|nr:hypothetical protein [Vibrio splendidus]AKN40495.1 hypothetical protein [Vibrio tasmaniensis]CAK2105746.1 CD-NTase-associated protein 7 [Vibrio crassostreae]MCC4791072.1 hypothetical protein [Vibrio splendidus]MDP2592850.1 hypothetical protein [Vibrio splendidus]PMM03816.1 hypothetical protein BCT62_21915 [Vibrio splendidus]
MSSSYTSTTTKTFTITHARHMSAKVSADLRRMQRFYNKPSSSQVSDFEEEIAQLLKNGYLDTATFGFQRDNKWIEPTFSYTASQISSGIDDTPGTLKANADVSNARFHSYVTYTDKYFELTQSERVAFKNTLPVQRVGADEPGASGFYENDKTYSSGERSLSRKSLRSY